MTALLRLCLLSLTALLLPATAVAQPVAPSFSGQTLEGLPFDLARHKGRVVMVMLWRTDCAVCLDKMPELRANAAGWKASPFDLVLVNLDRTGDDAMAYDRLRRQTTAPAPHLYSFWRGDVRLPAEWAAPARLPVTLIIDAKGRITDRFEGRVPPEVWNRVADLMP